MNGSHGKLFLSTVRTSLSKRPVVNVLFAYDCLSCVRLLTICLFGRNAVTNSRRLICIKKNSDMVGNLHIIDDCTLPLSLLLSFLCLCIKLPTKGILKCKNYSDNVIPFP